MMKKSIFKISLGLIFLFAFVYNVKADLNCGQAPKHKIIEVSMAEPAEFNTWANICEWRFTGRYSKVANDSGQTEFPTNTAEELDYITKLGDELIWVAQVNYADDFKSSTTSMVQVPRCGDSKRYYSATYTCRKYASKVPQSYTACADCTYNCKASEMTNSSCTTYVCPSGYVESDSEKGDCVKTMTGSKDDKDRKKPYTADEVCGDGWTDNDVINTLNCPIYQCDITQQLIGACTPTFKVDGEAAYCVNPSQPFTQERGSDGFAKHEAYFSEDGTFDVNECANSYVTTDCGYANILMESKYHNDHGNTITQKSTELAMRLWGAKNTAAGYQFSFGLSLRYGSTADNQGSCDSRTLFLFQGIDENVYYVTQKYITEQFMQYVTNKYSEKDYIDPISFRKDDEFGKHFVIDCNKIGRKIGLVCGNGAKSRSYRTSFGLFFNTTLGNSQFREHMREVFGITVNAPNGVDVEEDSDGDVGIVVDYGNFELTAIEKDKEYDCDDVKNNSSKYSQAEREAILPYCRTKIIYYDLNGNQSETVPEMCKGKNSLLCKSKPVNLAVCSTEEYSKTVIIEYPDKRNSHPSRLINCASVDNQVMYAIIDDGDDGDSGSEPGETKQIPFTLKLYSCNGNCNASDLRTNEANCTYDKNKPDGNVSTGYVKDPSLNCIVNASNDSDKTMHDYSQDFGVNTKFCRVYCSDEVEYYIPDKITIKSGLAFKYDIGVKSYLTKTDNHLISNVVKSKRTCVSEIYYNKYFTSATNFEKMYNLDTEKDITNVLGGRYIQNWKDLYTVLKAKSAKERGRTENINELLYDLYNCNFYNKNSFGNVTKPKQKVFETNSTIDNVYDNMKKTYGSSNSYGFDNCTINGNSNDCFTMNRIDYSGGSEVTASTFVGKDTYINTGSVVSSNISEVKYCMGSSCFRYPDNVTANSVEDLETYNYSKYMKDSTVITDGKYKIPTNDYAIFSINTEFGFYNNSRFQTVQSTGYIKPGSNDPNYITLSEYSYPVSKNAYGTCKFNGNNNNSNIFKGRIDRNNNKDLGPSTNSSCVVTHKYDQIHTYKYRHDNDKFMNILLSSTFKNPNCYYDVEPSQVQCDAGTKNCKSALEDIAEYRNVERTNIFPNDEDVPAATNWDNENAKQVKDVIESTGKSVFTNPDFIQYSFTIGPDQIKSIRSYNNNNTSSYINTELNNCQVKDGMYFNCRSKFMDEIRNGNVDTSSTYATVNDNKDGSNLFE